MVRINEIILQNHKSRSSERTHNLDFLWRTNLSLWGGNVTKQVNGEGRIWRWRRGIYLGKIEYDKKHSTKFLMHQQNWKHS